MTPAKRANFNGHGRRIGEGHPRATLTDHEVELLQELLDRRTELIDLLVGVGAGWVAIRSILFSEELSYHALAAKFDVTPRQVRRIDTGNQRCQTPGP